MSPETWLILSLAVPLYGALMVALTNYKPRVRDAWSIFTSCALFVVIVNIFMRYQRGVVFDLAVIEPIPHIPLRLTIEPLGLLFALVASSLWIITTIYAIGYMRGNNEANQTRFFTCFAISIAATMGIAFSGNLFTLFCFYEILTFSTYPLVTHKQTDAAKSGGRRYLGILLTTSICFFLLAILLTWLTTHTLTFKAGGIFPEHVSDTQLLLLYTLFAFGVGKAALMPFHKWLPSAMVAPTPVSALLHAVAVVKAGVFTVLKISIYIFGLDRLQSSLATEYIMWVAAITILASSCIALSKDNLKARLAYSTISQLSYIVLGAALATAMSVTGATLHIVMHALGKITLFFCAGAIYTATKKTEISDLDGLGRRMPLTFLAFLLASLSIIGIPPFGGAWSKFYLMLGAADAGQQIMIFVLIISSLLNIAYLLPIPVRAFFAPAKSDEEPFAWSRVKEAPALCVIPLCLTALGGFAISFGVGWLLTFIEGIVS